MNYKVVSYKDIVKKPWCNSTNLTKAVISDNNWTEWSTIQGVCRASNFKIGRTRSARPI